MKLNTVGAVLVAAAVVLGAGCGSDDNTAAVTGIDTSRPVDCAGADTLTAEGSTSQQNAIALFNLAWRRLCPGKNLSYNPTGSGAGRQQFVAGHVDFAGSDSPLSAEQAEEADRRCAGNPAWHLPLVLGPLVLAYHLSGVDSLVLSADVAAGIFTGAITRWTDPAIVALNPAAALPGSGPAAVITPVYRSDSAGATDNFQQYLAAAAPQRWDRGAGSEFQGGVGEGAQKSAGVVQAVQTTPGAIGYVEKGFADQAGLRFARIDSGAGPVAVSPDAVTAALETVEFVDPGSNDLRLNLDSLYAARTAGTYPLVLPTYEIVCSGGYGAGIAAAVRSFLTVAAANAQGAVAAAGYLPLPDRFRNRLLDAIQAIRA